MEFNDLLHIIDEINARIAEFGPTVQWVQAHWAPILLTGEIIGGVIAIKLGRYRRGVMWLIAALVTIWAGVTV